MLKIRLQRIGRRNQPHYRVVVAEHTVGPKSNNFTEIVGTFNPRSKDLRLKTDRITHWLSVGAQASDRVHNMLVKEGIVKGKVINVLPHKSPVIDEEKIAKEKEEAEAKKLAEEESKKAAEEAKKAEAEAKDAESEKAEDAPEQAAETSAESEEVKEDAEATTDTEEEETKKEETVEEPKTEEQKKEDK